MIPLVIDTDPGIDDALALIYARSCGAFDLQGVTTIFGNVTVAQAARNALWLLSALGLGQVPVAQGAAAPLDGRWHDPSSHVHGAEGFGNWPAVPQVGRLAPNDAADLLIAASHRHPGTLQVAALGPLTNLALAARRDPGFADRIGALHVMGGAFRCPGNVNPYAEANILNDPAAAEVVARAFPRLVFYGLDVTDRLPLTPDLIATLATANPGWAPFVTEIDSYYRAFYHSIGKPEGPSLHDPAVILALHRPDMFGLVEGRVSVVQSGPETGRTLLADGQGRTKAALTMDAPAIMAAFDAAFRQTLPPFA